MSDEMLRCVGCGLDSRACECTGDELVSADEARVIRDGAGGPPYPLRRLCNTVIAQVDACAAAHRRDLQRQRDLARVETERDEARRERDAALARCRVATQTIVAAIGAAGPENVESATARIVAEVEQLRDAVEDAEATANGAHGDLASEQEHRRDIEEWCTALDGIVARTSKENVALRDVLARVTAERDAARDESAQRLESLDAVARAHERDLLAIWQALGETHEPPADVAAIVARVERLRAVEAAAREYLAMEGAHAWGAASEAAKFVARDALRALVPREATDAGREAGS